MSARHFALLLALAFGCGHAWAFGPAAHVYIVRKIAGDTWPQAAFGATLPDMGRFGVTEAIQSRTANLTHSEWELMGATPFGMGFITHNGEWGADWYVHCHHQGYENTYMTMRMRAMVNEFGITMLEAEDILDGVVDYLVGTEQAPDLGLLLKRGAELYGPAEEQQVVDAYAQPLADGVAGLSLEQAEAELRAMGQQYRTVMQVYGQQLATADGVTVRGVLVQGLAAYLGEDLATVDAYVSWGEEMCWDYEVELDHIVVAIEEELEATPFQLPLATGCGVVAGLLLGGLGVWRIRRPLAGAPRECRSGGL